ncbi:hypothetical protein NQ315_001747 [Exocentrus adspersus]|uniref:Ankyrin repeat domain-containing protein 40 n=1 Tax=Exocentrus adspersus TaxID=1586481 RepID=A0AAV8WA52_9CUCU|nr:hypothetical protein NQ315_001747 [Exocentrus adspersus]
MASILEEKLREAACLGDAEAVQTLLSQNVNVNSQNPVNGTALHWACKRGNEEITKSLIDHGANKLMKNFKGEIPSDLCAYPGTLEQLGVQQDELGIKFIPNYIKSPPLNGQVDIGPRHLRPKHTDLSSMPTTCLPTSQSDDLVLKVKLHGSSDPDFIEVDIPKWKLTYNNLLKICCEELEVMECQVERIRKLPNTRLRKDSDVKRLREFDALELVLKVPASGDAPSNCYQSISTCKDQTILY